MTIHSTMRFPRIAPPIITLKTTVHNVSSNGLIWKGRAEEEAPSSLSSTAAVVNEMEGSVAFSAASIGGGSTATAAAAAESASTRSRRDAAAVAAANAVTVSSSSSIILSSFVRYSYIQVFLSADIGESLFYSARFVRCVNAALD